MDQNSGLFTVIAYFFKVFTNLRFHTGWSISLMDAYIAKTKIQVLFTK